MTFPTSRNTSPAAMRAGRCAVALPHDPGLDELFADPALGSTAKMIASVLVKNWAWSKDHCWPSDRTIAARVGKSPGHVQRCLRQLEQAGWIGRERTDEVPTGRRIWLSWRRPGGREGARGETAPAREDLSAPARDERVVVVNEGREPEIQPAPPRRRPEAAPIPTPAPESGPTSSTPMIAPPPVPRPPAQEPHGRPRGAEGGDRAIPIGRALRELAGGLLGGPVGPTPPEDSCPVPVVPDLEATEWPTSSAPSRPPAPEDTAPPGRAVPVTPATAPFRRPPRTRGLGLNLAELIAVVAATGDPILKAELDRLQAPPPPPEPPPQALPTAELFAKLPGRHDLIAAATRRLAEETADFRPASWSFFRKAVEAVAARVVPFEVLLDTRRQATGPRARDPGRVFVVAWKRAVPLRC